MVIYEANFVHYKNFVNQQEYRSVAIVSGRVAQIVVAWLREDGELENEEEMERE